MTEKLLTWNFEGHTIRCTEDEFIILHNLYWKHKTAWQDWERENTGKTQEVINKNKQQFERDKELMRKIEENEKQKNKLLATKRY